MKNKKDKPPQMSGILCSGGTWHIIRDKPLAATPAFLTESVVLFGGCTQITGSRSQTFKEGHWLRNVPCLPINAEEAPHFSPGKRK